MRNNTHTLQLHLHLPVPAKRYQWPVVVFVTIMTGLLPITVSGALELIAIVALPVYLGFLISRSWIGWPKRLGLALILSLLGVTGRLASSSFADASNWFARFFQLITLPGIADPSLRHILLLLLFPVGVTLTATIMFSAKPFKGE